jgi:hypothetical protein
MKSSHFLFLFAFGFIVLMSACKDKGAADTTQEQTTSPEGTVNADPAAAVAGGGTEQHYKCTKAGCTGGGAAQGKCPICGSDLVHNQAFHAQNTPAGSSPANPVQIDPKTGQPVANAQPTPPPAQNAKGEYHYTCAKGHAGAATAGNCATCGGPLTHNQAYHNN